jgi:hypothetical protein
MENQYDFESFLKRMSTLDYDVILTQASAEVAQVERVSFRVKGAPSQREHGSSAYASRIKAFLFYLRSGTKPGSANASEFSMYKPVIVELVNKKQLKPEILRQFE